MIPLTPCYLQQMHKNILKWIIWHWINMTGLEKICFIFWADLLWWYPKIGLHDLFWPVDSFLVLPGNWTSKSYFLQKRTFQIKINYVQHLTRLRKTGTIRNICQRNTLPIHFQYILTRHYKSKTIYLDSNNLLLLIIINNTLLIAFNIKYLYQQLLH